MKKLIFIFFIFTYQQVISSITTGNITTCTGACCNLTYCTTVTDQNCNFNLILI